MANLEWAYVETVQKRIRVLKVNHKERHLDAQELNSDIPLCLDAAEKMDLEKIKKAKIYLATIKVYHAPLNPELERELAEMAIGDPHLRRSLQTLKASGSILKKYELTALKN